MSLPKEPKPLLTQREILGLAATKAIGEEQAKRAAELMAYMNGAVRPVQTRHNHA